MTAPCPVCRVPLDDTDRFCAACGAPARAGGGHSGAATASAPYSSPLAPARGAERFLPGTVVAGRYRMVGLLGRGGMGEVYRADDLKLGQPVALKFLPTDVEQDQDRLQRFLNEVRLSLRVTHPNVCRVFDIGQIEAAGDRREGRRRHFISMEFVDGEDLASLLRRIGRLPEDKAVEIARQLCAGLAAAHDEGVLHRDLKPANIMIDGRGRAKIADFGLAGAAEEISGLEARAGTPQYMAPEQAAGGALSERTDVYALGLVLYELFTGRRAFEIRNLDELQRLASSTPTSPSAHVSGLNPLVERAILRCLEPDPSRRPASAAALAAALPGGDPLAMAIAAGDTPSPEMVAAAGSDAGLPQKVAWPLLAVAIAGAVVAAWLGQHAAVYRIAAPLKPPAVLVERAREIVRGAGLGGRTVDHDWGLSIDIPYLNHAAAGRPVGPQDSLEARGVRFWYRESPVLLEHIAFIRSDLISRGGYGDPSLAFAGEVRLMLDREGRLTAMEAVPAQVTEAGSGAIDADWPALFKAAGLDHAAWRPADPQWTPLVFGDRRIAWVPPNPPDSGPVRVEASSFQGRPVSFHVIFPWTEPLREVATVRTAMERTAHLIQVLMFTAVMLGSALVARRNLRLDRGDRRGAVRLAAFVALLSITIWALDEHHVPSIWEMYLFLMGAGWSLFCAALLATCYLALEPYVRRVWPAMIVSWSRIVAGRVRDTLVARDVLIGCAVGVAISTVEGAIIMTTRTLSGAVPRMLNIQRSFLGTPHVVADLAFGLVYAIFIALVLVFVLFVLRLIVRSEWVAVLTASVALGIPFMLADAQPLALFPLGVLLQALIFVTLARVGLVAFITAAYVTYVLRMFPFVWPPSAWYAGVGLTGIAVTAAIAVAAFRVATGAGITGAAARRTPALAQERERLGV